LYTITYCNPPSPPPRIGTSAFFQKDNFFYFIFQLSLPGELFSKQL
jgi:hypothetical protein